MPFSALVNLGTIGSGISGQNVSISGCTGASCASGCSSLLTAQTVSSFPKTISSIPDNVVSLFVSVDGGSCAGTTQCITITTGTPSPTATATPVAPTATPGPTATLGPTPTATALQPTPTSTPVPPTPTPTSTSSSCLTGDSTSTGNCDGSDLATFTLGSGYSVVVKPQGYFYSGTGTRYAYAYLRTNTGTNIQQFTLTQVNSNTPTFSPTGYTLTTPGTYQLYVEQVDCNQGGGTGGSGTMYLDATDCQIYVGPTATPVPPTATPVPPTATPSACVNGVGFEVDVAGEVRYVTCAGTTEYVTFGIGPQYISECIQNNSLFGLSATISQVSYGSPCTVSPTPTPTSTTELGPTPTLEETQWCYTYNDPFTQQPQTYGPFSSQQECQTASNNAGHFAVCYQCVS